MKARLDPQGEVGPGAAGGIEGLTEGWEPASARSLKASGFQKGRGLRQVWPKARGQWLHICQDQGCKSPAGLSTGPSRALGLVTRRTPTPPGPSLPQGEAALRSGWRTRGPQRCVRQPARGASAPSRRAACSSCITLAKICYRGLLGGKGRARPEAILRHLHLEQRCSLGAGYSQERRREVYFQGNKDAQDTS